MGQYEYERAFSAIYLCSAIVSLIALISSAVVFGTWSATLNYPCINDVSDGIGRDGYGLGAFAAGDCGCIFYGEAMAVTTKTAFGFKGGHTSICHFVIFSPVPVFVVSLILGLYHAYRFCIVLPRKSKKLQKRMIKSSQWENANEEITEEKALNKRSRGRSPQRKKNEVARKRARSASPSGRRPRSAVFNASVTVVPNYSKLQTSYEKQDDSFGCWGPIAVVGVVIALLALSTAVVSTGGHARTCSEWRRVALRMLQASGDLARVITTRLSCGAIFDFMDYLQPRKVIYHGYTYEFGGPSHGRTVRDGDATVINTAAGLGVAITAAWINFMLWTSLVVFNTFMAIKRYKSVKKNTGSTCCVCC